MPTILKTFSSIIQSSREKRTNFDFYVFELLILWEKCAPNTKMETISLCLSLPPYAEPALIHGGERNYQLDWPRNNIAERKVCVCVCAWRVERLEKREHSSPPGKSKLSRWGGGPRVAFPGFSAGPEPLLLPPRQALRPGAVPGLQTAPGRSVGGGPGAWVFPLQKTPIWRENSLYFPGAP